MSKKTNKITYDGGITIELIGRHEKRSVRANLGQIFGPIFQFLLIALCMAGAFGTFTSMMSIFANQTAVYITIAALIVALMVLYTVVKRSYIITLCTLGTIIAAAGVCYKYVYNGSLVIYDKCAAAIADSMKWSAPALIVKNPKLFALDVDITLCIAFALITLFVTYFAFVRVNFIGVLLFTFPLFEIGAAFGCVPNKISFALLVSAWAAMLTMQMAGRMKIKIKNKEGGKKSGKKKINDRKNSTKFVFSAVCIALVTFMIFGLAQNFLVSKGYERSENMNTLRHDIREAVSNAYDLITGEDHDGSLKEGRLTKVGDLKYKMRHYMTIDIPDVSESVYLRGYVGDVYTGTSWEDAENEELDNVSKAIAEYDASVATLTGSFLNSSSQNYLYPSGDITLSEFRRKKQYAYILYGTFASPDYKINGDATVSPKNNSEYQYHAYLDTNTPYDVTSTPLYKSSAFQKLLSQYEQLAKEQYTALPESLPQSILDIAEKFTGNDYHKVDLIREYMSKNTEFSLYSRKISGNEDFVDFFLNEQKHGYSTHYATAATVLLRAAGVTARYVEGYYIPLSQIEEAGGVNIDNIKHFELTDMNAHAWVEIYVSKYGWFPVEVTPGFYTSSFEEMMNEKNDNDLDGDEEEEIEDITDIYETDFDDVESIPNMDDAIQGEGEEQVIKQIGYLEENLLPIILISLASLIVLTIISFVAVRFIRVAIRKNKLKNGNATTRMFALYDFYLKLLRFEKIVPDNKESYADFVNAMAKSLYIEQDESKRLMEIFIKSGFANEKVSEDDYSTAKELVLGYEDKLYHNKYEDNPFKRLFIKLKYKYINALR